MINSDKGLKSVDSQNIVKIFSLIEKEFTEVVMAEFVDTSSQLDILVDIIIKDGNCIIKQEWFSRLYENKLKKLKGRILKMKASLENEKSELSDNRKRDYLIYRACVNDLPPRSGTVLICYLYNILSLLLYVFFLFASFSFFVKLTNFCG